MGKHIYDNVFNAGAKCFKGILFIKIVYQQQLRHATRVHTYTN